jgi:branched-chain amino acid transport system ATP-binding protein
MRVVQGVTIEVHSSEIVLVIGHNGAGKSTLLKTLFGLIPESAGSITYAGKRIADWSIADRLSAGMVYLPQGGGVFPELKVSENIELGGKLLPTGYRINRVDQALQVFPQLKPMMNRRAGTLSGGEQQMVALARGLVYTPKLLMLDEPSLGLAPEQAQKIFETISFICHNAGPGVLLVEQKIRAALAIADRVYVLKEGRVAFEGAASTLRDDQALASAFL